MDLPVMPPVAPMLAKAVPAMPEGDYFFEPKWDGFRSIVFRDGDEVEIGSRNERPMTRYFPEIEAAVRAELPPRCVIDGEIVLPDFAAGRLDFEALQLRLHPAASRVRLLAAQTPAHFVAFDLLALGDTDYTERPFAERRSALESALAAARPPIHLTPVTLSRAVAEQWFTQFEGAGLDGLIAKSPDGAYEPDRRVMFKIKHERTADCVVAGYRPHKSGDDAIGSLLLGLYKPSGDLASVGVIGAFPMAVRRELRAELEALVTTFDGHPWNWAAHMGGASGADGAGGGEGVRTPRSSEYSRWNVGKDLSFVPLRPERVVEVRYDHMEGTRFRHTAQFVRWRPDREPSSCTFDQLEEPVSYSLSDILGKELRPVIPSEWCLSPMPDPKTIIEVAGREVAVSNPQKVYFPRTGHTKLDLVRYYLAVADGALHGVAGRPMALKRFVNGAEEEPFFQKRAPSSRPSWIETAELRFPSGRTADEVVLRDAAGLAWVANLGCIDLNPHPVLASDLDHPDELRVDLDPVPGIGWPQIISVALSAREVLADFGLTGWAKTSGSRGIHIYARIAPRWTFTDVRLAAVSVAREIERRLPDLATSKWWKEERHGVFVDYNQNAKDRTVASAYSVRPLPDARVSTPLTWDEIPGCDPAAFTIDTVPARFAKSGDPWEGMNEAVGSLDALLEQAARDQAAGLPDAPWPPHYEKQSGEDARVQPSKRRPPAGRAGGGASRAGSDAGRAGGGGAGRTGTGTARGGGTAPSPTGRRQSTKPLIEIARAKTKDEALEGLDRWKARHPDVWPLLEPADVLIDSMRGRSSTWTRIRLNLEHVPPSQRPPQEPLEVDYDPWAGFQP